MESEIEHSGEGGGLIQPPSCSVDIQDMNDGS